MHCFRILHAHNNVLILTRCFVLQIKDARGFGPSLSACPKLKILLSHKLLGLGSNNNSGIRLRLPACTLLDLDRAEDLECLEVSAPMLTTLRLQVCFLHYANDAVSPCCNPSIETQVCIRSLATLNGIVVHAMRAPAAVRDLCLDMNTGTGTFQFPSQGGECFLECAGMLCATACTFGGREGSASEG